VRRPFSVRAWFVSGPAQELNVVVLHVPGTALCRLVAVGIAAGCPQDAGEEDDDNYGHNDEWGSDIHG
jgi:hypothetical protein